MSPFRLFRWAAGPGIKHVRAEIFGQTAMKRSLLRPNWKRLFNKWNGLCFTGQVSSLTWGGLAVALQKQGVAWGSLSRYPWDLAMQQACEQKHGKKYFSIQKIDPDIRFVLVFWVVGLVWCFFEGWVVSAQLQSCMFVSRYWLIEGTFSSSL